VDSNSEIQGYNVYPMLHFYRKFSSGVTMRSVCLSIWGCQAVEEDTYIPSSLYSSLVNKATN